jgi:GAF domain-containing protein/anti-sigma regulatory factor (Ser/Thr protein kinase)
MPSETSATSAAQSVEELTAELSRARAERDEAHRREAATAEVLRVISKCTTDVQPVFDAIVVSSKSLLGAHSAIVSRIAGRELVLAAYTPINPTADDELKRWYPRPLDGTFLASVVGEGAPHVVSDTEADDSVLPSLREVARSRGFRSILSVPMLSMGTTIGTINVTRATPGAFSDKDIALLQIFADQAVIAIENTRLFEAEQARSKELRESLEYQTATAELLAVISRSPSKVQPVFDLIVKTAQRLCHADHAFVLLAEMSGYRLAAAHDAAADWIDGLKELSFAPGRNSVTGRVALDRRTVHIHDILADPEYSLPVSQRHNVRTNLGVPLMRNGNVVGVIVVGRTRVEPFTPPQIALVETFADQAVIAIENTRLFEAEQASKRELQESLEYQTATSGILDIISRSKAEIQPVFDAIVHSAARLFYPCTAAITTLKDGFLHWNGAASLQPAFGPVQQVYPVPFDPERVPSARAILERRTVVIPDATATDMPEFARKAQAAGGFRSIAYVPLVNQDKGIGTIVLAHPQPGFELTRKQIELLETFAGQAVIAIENTRLFEEVQARTRELTEALEQQTATAEVLSVISSSPGELEPVFQAMLASATHLCGANFGTLFRSEGDAFRSVALHNPPPMYAEMHRRDPIFHPSPVTAFGRAVATKQPVQVADMQSDPAYVDVPPGFTAPQIPLLAGARTALAVPMLKEDEVVGAIIIYRQEVKAFSDKQIELVESFADQVVIAIENTRLLNELRESLQQQTATADVLKVISRATFDLPRVLDTLVESAASLCDSDDTAIIQRDGGVLRVVSQRVHTPSIGQQDTFPVRGGGPVGRAILDRQTIHLADAQSETDEYPVGSEFARRHGFRSILAVPLLRAGEAVGAITLRRSEVRPFTDRQIELLQTFADQAVIAIENTRLFEAEQASKRELKESLEYQTATSEVLGVISRSKFELQPVLDTIASAAARLCGGLMGGVLRYGGELMDIGAMVNFAPGGEGAWRHLMPRPATKDTAAGRAILERMVVIVPDVESDARSEWAREGARTGGYRSAMAVPLLREGVPIGAIVVARAQPGKFADAHVEVLRTFADQAVIAIENTRLFEEIAQKSRDLEIASAHKSQFVANMSHELRTPLAAILGYAELMQEGFYEPQGLKSLDALTRIRSNGKHLLGLINTVLDIAKIESGQFTLNVTEYAIESVVETVRSATESLAQNKKLALKTEVAKSLPIGLGDEQRLTQVLLNLVGNAIKFTDTGEVRVTAKAVNGHFNVSVTDTGPGIPEQEQVRIFEQFHQVDSSLTKAAGGTGLGLAIAKQIVEMHGGRIWVESTLGKGSTFQMELPTRAELRRPAS